MALSKSFLLPHSPLLIPEIGRANHHFLEKTTAAYNQAGEAFKGAGIGTIIIISPHSLNQEDAFTMNVAPEMNFLLKDFGFMPAAISFPGDALLADQIKNSLRSDYVLSLVSEPILDYGSAIPAYLLKNLCPDFKLIVLSPAVNLSLEEHFKFGQKLASVLEASDKKIAVIASGDMSHRLKRKSPGGYSPKGAKFDNKLIEYLSEPKTAAENILKMDAKLIKDAGECGLKPLTITLGLLAGKKYDTRVLAYQTDFGIGYLSLEFIF